MAVATMSAPTHVVFSTSPALSQNQGLENPDESPGLELRPRLLTNNNEFDRHSFEPQHSVDFREGHNPCNDTATKADLSVEEDSVADIGEMLGWHALLVSLFGLRQADLAPGRGGNRTTMPSMMVPVRYKNSASPSRIQHGYIPSLLRSWGGGALVLSW